MHHDANESHRESDYSTPSGEKCAMRMDLFQLRRAIGELDDFELRVLIK